MPRDPDESTSRQFELDDEKKWRFKLVGLDEAESKFTDRRKNATYLQWWFTAHDIDTGVAVLDANDDMARIMVPTNDATYFNPENTRYPLGGAREMANVLLANDLSDKEVRALNAAGIDGWRDALVGKTMMVDVEWQQTAEGYPRLKVIRKRPDRRARIEEPAPNGEPARDSRGETPEERRARLVRELEAMDASPA